ncbi:rhodanese-related sulfurtransferase [Akkermansiaceae bacterium]|nr:rhodanese-related sulfurtransferase [Akkermansiaceae bacterium]MDB4552548.1 rhodanese-related sulfurtransferase [bacterium]MDA8974666.1 rhodanese-related sulfurtransferase [Akkermansiaceae bacterium]MDB4361954.1 rhodanese-related sulfurtransferase [Akkermansiaceae bacterium]MDB4366167.1 rhodanese-related sulfurtransferase [Akkermansiaceae bacterium]
MTAPYEVLLYYKYARLDDPDVFAADHRLLCQQLELRGRIVVATEGLNGTVSGTKENCAKYRKALDKDPIMAGIAWKIDPEEGHVFPKLSIKVRNEVVTLELGEEDFNPVDLTASHLKPLEWREAMKEDHVVLLDARNDYEWEIGHFEGAILPKVPSFKDLPKWIRDHRSELEGKKILSYCTGGIRCEKLSGFLLNEGFDNVFQLDGGIVTYGKDKEVRGEGYEGECYVFDERLSVSINQTEEAKVVSKCRNCGVPSIRYRNCAWMPCNAQILLCEDCEERIGRYCDCRCKEVDLMSRSAVIGI